jgi:hypothetical protein
MTMDDLHNAILDEIGDRLRTATEPCSCDKHHTRYVATCSCDSEPDFSTSIVRCSKCSTAFRVEWS